MSIGPCDELAPGTRVNVQGKRGTVLKCEFKRDQFGMPIAVHTIHFTERHHSQQGGKPIYKPMNKTSAVNYSAIQVI